MASHSFIRYSRRALLWIRDGTAPDSEFIPKLALTHQLWKPQPADWLSLLSRPVTGCWLAAREREPKLFYNGYVDDRNPWVVILETPDGQNVTIELKEVDTKGNTITICRPGAPLRIKDGDFDGFELLEGYACSFRNEAKCQIKIEDWINRLEKSGVTRYQLQHHRGHRYWIDTVLRQIQSFIEDAIPNIDETEMLHIWTFGYVEESGGAGPIVAGRFLPTMWTEKLHSPMPSWKHVRAPRYETNGQNQNEAVAAAWSRSIPPLQ